MSLRVAPPYVRPANGWPWGIVVTLTSPFPYGVEALNPLPNVVPDTGTVDPREPTGGGEEGLLPLEPEEPLLLPEEPLLLPEDDSSWPVDDPFGPDDEPLEPLLCPPPCPPPPVGSGTGLRGWTRRRASQVSLHELAHEERKGTRI